MNQKIFQSTHPILLANMNKGTVLPLSVAVHNAGGYASLCSWTYGENLQFMQNDLEKFIQATGSSKINLSFEASLITEPDQVLNMIKTFKIPTIEVIYGQYLTTTFWMSMSPEEIDRKIKSALEPIHDLGVKIFKRALEPHTPEQMHRHFIDGLMIQGSDAAGAANAWAGTTGLDTVGALNAKAGTTGIDLMGVCNVLAGTSGLGPALALRQVAS
jgi:NAD(P)H-dependent flavin oxidoreductase YrpB (nitropropane dioxygenase family)